MADARLDIRLKPRAKGDRVTVSGPASLNVAVTSPPIDGKANEHLIKLLAKKLGTARSKISIIVGGHSRNKAVAIEGMTTEEVIGKISDL